MDLFETNIPANQARALGFALLDKAMEIFPNLSFDSYDRLFPNQDVLPEGGFGNLIALPLQKEARLSGLSCFVDNDLNAIDDQWQYLAELKTLTQSSIGQLITTISPNTLLLSEQGLTDNRPPWEITAKAAPIKLESLPKNVTITLANHIYFLMSELPGPLLAGLKRLASFSNPVFLRHKRCVFQPMAFQGLFPVRVLKTVILHYRVAVSMTRLLCYKSTVFCHCLTISVKSANHY